MRSLLYIVVEIFKDEQGCNYMDDDTLEVNINGRDYPGSSIVDILSYLADKIQMTCFIRQVIMIQQTG